MMDNATNPEKEQQNSEENGGRAKDSLNLKDDTESREKKKEDPKQKMMDNATNPEKEQQNSEENGGRAKDSLNLKDDTESREKKKEDPKQKKANEANQKAEEARRKREEEQQQRKREKEGTKQRKVEEERRKREEKERLRKLEKEKAAQRKDEERRKREEKNQQQKLQVGAGRENAEAEIRRREEEEPRRRLSKANKAQQRQEIRSVLKGIETKNREEDEREAFARAEERRKLQEKRERERRIPANWPIFVYNIDSKVYDLDVGCVIRAIEGSLQKEDVRVTCVDQHSGIYTLEDHEEVVSNIIEIRPEEPEKKFSFEEPLRIAFPHCSPEDASTKETILKMLQSNGEWIELKTFEVHFDQLKELNFLEIRTKTFGTFVVVRTLKKEQLTFQRDGGKVTSAVDSRVTFAYESETFRVNVNFTLEMLPVEPSTVSDVKDQTPAECDDLLSSSSIVKFSSENRDLLKPLTVTLPLPPALPSRPNTAKSLIEQGETTAARSLTAKSHSAQNEETPSQGEALTARPQTRDSSAQEGTSSNDNDLHMLVHDNEATGWTEIPNHPIEESKAKDLVTFEMEKLFERFCVLRTKIGTPANKIEKMPSLLEQCNNTRPIRILLRQRSKNVCETAVACCPANRVERLDRQFNDDGYDEGPPLSSELFVKEGQRMEVRFRGNIGCVSKDKDLKFVYNTNVQNRLEFCVNERDRFAQGGFDTYRGFAQIFTDGSVPPGVKGSDEVSSGGSDNPKVPKEELEDDVLMTEFLILLPKGASKQTRSRTVAPVLLKTEGIVNDKLLRQISSELGDKWRSLAHKLNLKPMRIQAIERQYVDKPNDDACYDMLMSWAKRTSRSTDKANVLCQALTAVCREDIADKIKMEDEKLKRDQAQNIKDSLLRKMFIKIAQDPKAANAWHKIALQLGILDEEVQTIEKNNSSERERCLQSLKHWREIMGEEATVQKLTKHLKLCDFRSLANELATIFS